MGDAHLPLSFLFAEFYVELKEHKMAINTGYRGANYAVSIGTTFLKRLQSVEFNRVIPTEQGEELGRAAAVGVIQGTIQYTARLIANTVAAADLENMLSGATNPTPQNYIDATGVTVKGPSGGITAAKVMSVEYRAQAGTGPMTTNVELMGTGWTSGSVATPEADLVTPAAYIGKDVVVTIGSQVYRVQSFLARLQLTRAQLDELGNADPVGYGYDVPVVTCELELVHSDTAQPTLWLPATPTDIVAVVGSTVKTITCEDMLSTGQPVRSSVRGWATTRYTFQSQIGSLLLS
jgi:hypothetical protein